MRAPVGVVLAGGRGSRMGGRSKAAVPLAGRPLIARPVAALAGVCAAVAVLAKADTQLPPLPPGVERWTEPDEPRHPLIGIAFALECAPGAVLACAGDMPFVTVAALRALIAEARARPEAKAVVARTPRRIEPLLAIYRRACLADLRAAPPDVALARTVEALAPVLVPVPAEAARSVNTPRELAAAEAQLGGSSGLSHR